MAQSSSKSNSKDKEGGLVEMSQTESKAMSTAARMNPDHDRINDAPRLAALQAHMLAPSNYDFVTQRIENLAQAASGLL